MAQAIVCEIHLLSNLGALARLETVVGAEAKLVWSRENLARGLAAVEEMLDHPGFCGRFCNTTTPSLADCLLVSQVYNAARCGVGLHCLPRICAIGQACALLPAFQVAHPEHLAPDGDARTPATGAEVTSCD